MKGISRSVPLCFLGEMETDRLAVFDKRFRVSI